MKVTRRKKRLVKVGLQLRLVGVFVGLALLSSLAQVLVLSLVLEDLRIEGVDGSVAVSSLLLRGFGLAMLATVPVMTFVGILVTHRIAGPVYRFETYLEDLVHGTDDGPCRIRRGDELTDLCDRINEAVDHLRGRGTGGGAEDREAA